MFCASCGHQNEHGYKFCAGCGAALTPAPSAPPPDTPAPSAPAPSAPPPPTRTPAPDTPGGSPLSPPPSPGYMRDLPPIVAPEFVPIHRQPAHPANTLLLATVVVVCVVGAFTFLRFLLHRNPVQAPRTQIIPRVATRKHAAPTATTGDVTADNGNNTTDESQSVPVEPPQGLPTVSGAHTQVSLQSATMCRNVESNGAPVTPTNKFEPTWPLFCSVKACNLRPGSVVTACWQTPTMRSVIRRATSGQSGNYYVFFTLRPSAEWPIGQYKLFLIADGVLQHTLDFTVIPPSFNENASSSEGPSSTTASTSRHVVAAVTCRGVNRHHRPVGATEQFAPNEPFYLALHLRDVRRGAPVRVRWTHNAELLKELTLRTPGNGSGWVSFRLDPGDHLWPLGPYQAQISYDGSPSRTVSFKVVQEGH